MCGRIGFDVRPGDLAARFPNLRIPEDLPPRYNIAPTQSILIIDESQARFVRWGLDGRSESGHFNIREETWASSQYYRSLPRVLVPASHFYEWNGRQPLMIRRRDRRSLFLAALAGTWRGEPAAAILTTKAQGVVAPFHHRMPVMMELPDLEAIPVSHLVNDVRNDGPHLLEPPSVYQLDLLT